MEFYECKVRYQREIGEGKVQKISETYLIEAVSFGDAETRVLEKVQPFVLMGQEVEMRTIRKINIAELLPAQNGHYWFKVKLSLVSIDENAGKEKKITVVALVEALDMEDAYKAVNEMMKDSVTDYSILTLQQTDIVEVIRV